MDRQKISPFYRTLSPIGAAALPPPMKTMEKIEQGKGTADHLMPLGYLFRALWHSGPLAHCTSPTAPGSLAWALWPKASGPGSLAQALWRKPCAPSPKAHALSPMPSVP